MTYPKARYTKETGELSALLRLANSSSDLVRSTGTDALPRHRCYDGWIVRPLPLVNGAIPGWSGSPLHRTMAESFYILTGTVKIFDGKEWIDSQIRDFVHVPPGGIHAFSNESGEPASMLIHFAPGAPREAYFEGLNALAALTEDEKSAFLVAHDNLYV